MECHRQGHIHDYLLICIYGNYEKISFYTALCIEIPGQEKSALSKDFIRDLKIIKKMMEECKNKGIIADYVEIKEGRPYIGIIFCLNNYTKIREKRHNGTIID